MNMTGTDTSTAASTGKATPKTKAATPGDPVKLETTLLHPLRPEGRQDRSNIAANFDEKDFSVAGVLRPPPSRSPPLPADRVRRTAR